MARGTPARNRSAWPICCGKRIPLENGLWLDWPLAGFAGIADFR